MASTKHRRGRTIATAIVCLVLAGGAAVAIAIRKPTTTSTIATPSIFKTAAVSVGDLTTTERIDGTVELSSTLPVLHRIEGQTSSSTTPAASATTPAASPSASNNPAALSSTLLADCTTSPVPTTGPDPSAATTTTTQPADTTPVGTTPVDTTPAPTTTTTTVAAAPLEPCDTTMTTTVVTPDTAPAAPGGGARTGGAVGGGGGATASRSASAATGSSASSARVTQTITSIIAANTAIQQGDVLYTVDGAPVVALDGALPAWRTMSTSSTDGADIAQLEASLVALGYDPGLKVTVDNHFDSATRTMVKAWQLGSGVEATGTVALGSVVFLPSPTTVSGVSQTVGAKVGDGDTVLTLSTATQDVVVDVPAGDEAQVVPGLAVSIGNIEGTVSRLRSADRNGSVVVEAVIAPASPIANATGGSTVKVTLTLQNDEGVLIAPAEALVSRLDGTYAVQAQTADGTTKWLTVELLGVSGGNIAIRGDGVAEGTVLLLPA